MMRKSRLIRMDRELSEIGNVIIRVPSDYAMGRDMLSIASIHIDSNSKKAMKYVRRARWCIMKEKILATRYNLYSDLISISDDVKICDLNSRYHNLLDAGEYGKAAKILDRLSESETLIGMKPSVSVKLSRVGDGIIQLDLVSLSPTTLEINTIFVRSNGVDLERDVRAPFCLSPGFRKVVTCFYSPDFHEVDVELEYTLNGNTRAISKRIALTGGT